MKSIILTLIILMCITQSCQSPDQKDYSFTLEEYKQRGFPELNKSWNPEEYNILFDKLTKIKYQHPLSLPRKNSMKSGILFDRLIGKENLSFLDNDSILLQEKVFNIRIYGDFVDDLINIYQDIFRKEQYYKVELVYVHILKITVSQEMLNLAETVLQSENKKDHALVHDLQSIQQIYLNKMGQIMEQQKHKSLYSKKDYKILCDSMAAAVKRNMEWFEPETAKYVGQKLQEVMDSLEIPIVRKEYQEIISSLIQE